MPNEDRRPIKAVIFDMDGLLLDSESLYTRITNEILAPFNKQLTWEIKSSIMGRPALEAARIVVNRTGIPITPTDLVAAMLTRQRDLFPTVQPMPGALKLVQHLKKHHIPILIATGSSRQNFLLKSQNLSLLFSPFEGRVICGDDSDLKRGKPHPDPFLLAASRYLGTQVTVDSQTGYLEPPRDSDDNSQIRPDEILVFEDGLAGVRSAIAAGMRVTWVPDPELKRLSSVSQSDILPVDQVLDSLEDWKGSDWGLPSFD
ncbi:hypothetical protein O181_029865 [Austropuccinia psidii MF-1]|uniref:HAD-like protein n=1 Tax=Austropuccinia psidii MF-1 TaxID=1389203 RepID=A0A9Q3H5M0_9BASI|nr:hypothetical protein [Austropuccinia psidii MF-1]